MKHFLVTLKNGRQFGVLAQGQFEGLQLALEVVKENYCLDEDKEIADFKPITFYHKNGRVTE